MDKFLTLKEVSDKAGYTLDGITKLCIKHGIGVRDYNNEVNLINKNGEVNINNIKYKGMWLSDYVALFGWD